jgi:phosphotriesterase-related protein
MTQAAAGQVDTVRGPVGLDDRGTTPMHEHVFVLTPDVFNNYGDQYWDDETRVADAIDKLRRLKALREQGVTDARSPR